MDGKKFTLKNGIALLLLFLSVLLLPLAFSGGFSEFPSVKNDVRVLELWSVDTFEGGKNSRADFLKRCGMLFSERGGERILVRSMTKEQFLLNFESARPDLISFGAGIAEELSDFLLPYGGAVNVRDAFVESGRKNGVLLALPWCTGGYGTVERSEKKRGGVLVGQAEGHLPLCAAYFSGCAALSGGFEVLSQFDAYEGFLCGEGDVLFGSQRDFIRISERVARGTFSAPTYAPLAGYTDLVCYLGVLANEEGTKGAEKFLAFVTSDECQRELYRIGMFPVADGLSVYTQSPLAEMERALARPVLVPSVFLPKEERQALARAAQNALRGEENARKFLDNFVW